MGWDIGDLYTARATFRDEAGALANPDDVDLTVEAPDGTQTTPTPSSTATGIWTWDQSLTQSGVWVFKWVGTGAVTAVESVEVYVRRERL